MPRTTPLLLAACAALLLPLSACGGDDPAEATSTPSVAASASPIAVATPAVPAGFPDAPVAVTSTAVDGVTLEVYRALRSGDSVTLAFAARNTGAEQANLGQRLGSDPLHTDASGVSLFDPVGLKRYLVLLDSAGGCLCSSNAVWVEPGEHRFLTATFSAPPADVDSVTVETPIGSLPAIPLTEA
ncbi:hypothetical protein [Kineococcus radiotolerans]|uniref:Lipoprotein n=1 Tax=Kineococcus radiotolerans (strain ATCC BAA-149 / DSM 14245 / SRS30216) TaxID=266940 RepID=A6WFH1_KINRD|nr:hypothetical protein [Kineococcus radiotolerans]ABS05560.1 conserved hypothetical protein [Kineococcus radiotolerans SRS30216 = ATCC BAA-149]